MTMMYVCNYKFLFSRHLFSLTNGTTELFTLSSNSSANVLVVQYLLMNEQQQTREIENVSLSDHAFHHIAVAVHGIQLTVAVDGLFKLRQSLAYPVDVRAENIFIGTLNDGENPTLQGIVNSACVCVCVCCVRACMCACVCACMCIGYILKIHALTWQAV